MGYYEKLQDMIPKPTAKRHYTLLDKEDRIRVIQSAFNLTHGQGKRKKKRRKK